MFFRQITDPKLSQYSYLIGCQKTGEAMVIDPMRDVRQYFELAEKEKLRLTAAADTHIHADYVSGLRELAERGVKVYASDEGDEDWKYEWLLKSDYHYQLLTDGDVISVGNIKLKVIHTPGHTPEHIIFSITDKGGGADRPMGIITGDFIFAGDVGRPDLLETAAGVKNVMKLSAKDLFRSLETFKAMPGYMQVWPGHGAGSACGKAPGAVPVSTVGYEMQFNAALKEATTEENFVKFILEGQPEPPLYFARMKRINKIGPPVLGELPVPVRFGVNRLAEFAGNLDVALIDTRDRSAFMKRHLKGALFSPLDKQFNTTAGSYVRENQPVYLVINEDNLEEAVRDLVNIGLDDIKGYIPTAEYEKWLTENNHVASIPHLTLQYDGNKLMEEGIHVLDVRKSSEFSEGHIQDAQNIPHTRLLDRLEEVPVGKPVGIHCSAGSRSAVAASLLRRYGYDVIYFDGDFDSWFKK